MNQQSKIDYVRRVWVNPWAAKGLVIYESCNCGIKDPTNTSGDTSYCWFFGGFQQLSRPWNTAGVFSGLPEADQGPGLLQQLEHSGLLQVTTEAVPGIRCLIGTPDVFGQKSQRKHDP